VFGTPGSGKSTAVKELLESIRPGSSKSVLTYNLSQFDSASALTEMFHQIQDQALSSSEVPLVMFDEFDCKLGATDLGWLKYFLAPMQDAEFRGQSGKYKIGQAIFIFAGGTSATFEEFRKKARDNANNSSKLTDFVSRLLGFLNVRDINPPTKGRESESQRFQRQVKRGTILEFQLRKHAKDIIDGASGKLRISDDMIDAFLDAPQYEHGVRSMEAIVKMSRPVAGEFVPTSLPAATLLEMHAPRFMEGAKAETLKGRLGARRPKVKKGTVRTNT
jgi:hypothetical protein